LFVVLSSVGPLFPNTTTKIIITLFIASTLLFPVHLLVDHLHDHFALNPPPHLTMEVPFEQVLEHPKSPDFNAAASGFTYDSLAGIDYLQYPHTEAFGMPSIHRT
jgi:hypothetical protein